MNDRDDITRPVIWGTMAGFGFVALFLILLILFKTT